MLDDIDYFIKTKIIRNGASIEENSIGQRLNPMLKDAEVNGEGYNFFSEENKYTNIRAVGYLTDPKNWTKYANGENDVFAIGGPTIELFAASYNTMPLNVEATEGNYKKGNITLTVEQYGYKGNTNKYWLTTSQRHGIYNNTGVRHLWLASPWYSDSVRLGNSHEDTRKNRNW